MAENVEKKQRGGSRPGSGRPRTGSAERTEPVTVEGTIAKITDLLKGQGSYSRSLDFAISVAAGAYVAYHKCLKSIQKRQKVQYSLITREGSKVYKIYPDIETLPSLTRSLKDMLKTLGLTLDTLEAADDDPLDTLIRKVKSVENG